MVVVSSSSSPSAAVAAWFFEPGTVPVRSGLASAPPGAFSLDPAPSRCAKDPPQHPPGALAGSFSTRHHPGALRVGLGTIPVHSEVFWTRHHPGALRVRPGTIPVRLGSLACSPPGADFICVLAPSRRTGAPAEQCRVVPDNLTSHTPERDVGGRGGGSYRPI